jgi:hypothetical protein
VVFPLERLFILARSSARFLGDSFFKKAFCALAAVSGLVLSFQQQQARWIQIFKSKKINTSFSFPEVATISHE